MGQRQAIGPRCPLTLTLSPREREQDRTLPVARVALESTPPGARTNRPTCHSERSEESQMPDPGREVERSRFLTFVRNDRKGMRRFMTPARWPSLGGLRD